MQQLLRRSLLITHTDLDTFTGTNKKCSVILPNGTVETKNVTGIVGSVITLDSALSATT